ncbi:MAG: hypothetical protein IJK47_04930 [Lachnospiraceae bacterium]|nr:hypothetical protein [Lachnospiraceae bacterium]
MEGRKKSGPLTDSFDELLEESLPEIADPATGERVNPWRQSMNDILASLALGFINLQFGNLIDLLFPLLSTAFGLLGWYRLRRENKGFRLGCVVMFARTAVFFLDTFRSFTIVGTKDLFPGSLYNIIQFFFILLYLLQLFALKQGIGLLQKKAGRQEDTLIITALIVWCVVLAFLALAGGGGGLVAIIMMLIVAVLLYQIWKLSRTLDEIGYAIVPAPSRLTPAAMMELFLGVLFAGSVLCFVCFGRYPMKWEKYEAAYAPASVVEIGVPKIPSETEILASQLIGMGFPEEVLTDLSEEDLNRCKGALKIYTQDSDCSAFGVSGMRMRSVAVVLSEEPRLWRIFYHFSLRDESNYWGTDALEIRPTALFSYIPEITQEPEGRILREEDGRTLSAPVRMQKESYSQESVLFGSPWSGEAWFASFSLPHSFHNARGYVTLEVKNIYEDVDFSWGYNALILIQNRWWSGLLYTHQTSPWQYPVRSAKTAAMQSTASAAQGAFVHITIPSWFFPEEY